MAYGNGLFSSSHAEEARRAGRQAYAKTKEAAHLASHGAREAGAAVAERVKQRASDAKHITHDVSEKASEQAIEARDYILGLLGALTSQTETMAKSAKARLKDLPTEDYAKTAAVYSGKAIGVVKRHPLLAIGGAVAIGFLIGKAVEAAAARRDKAEADDAEGVSAGEGDAETSGESD